MKTLLEQKLKTNWKGITSLLCWGVVTLMMTTGFFLIAEKIIPPFLGNIIEVGISCFGLLCAISAILTEAASSKLLGVVGFVLLLAEIYGFEEFYSHYYGSYAFR